LSFGDVVDGTPVDRPLTVDNADGAGVTGTTSLMRVVMARSVDLVEAARSKADGGGTAGPAAFTNGATNPTEARSINAAAAAHVLTLGDRRRPYLSTARPLFSRTGAEWVRATLPDRGGRPDLIKSVAVLASSGLAKK
jgi:hypothetical protein